MNLRLTRVAVLALGLAAPTLSFVAPRAAAAQQGRFGFGGAQFSILRLPNSLQDRLKLTADQKTKLGSITERQRGEMQGLFQGGGGDRQAMMEKLRTLNEKSEAEAVAVLTADQKKMYEGWKADAANYQGLGRSGVALISVSGINDDQKTKLKALSTSIGAKRQDLFQSAQGDFQGIREKMQAMESETEGLVKKILTGDQVKQYEVALAEVPQGGRRRPN